MKETVRWRSERTWNDTEVQSLLVPSVVQRVYQGEKAYLTFRARFTAQIRQYIHASFFVKLFRSITAHVFATIEQSSHVLTLAVASSTIRSKEKEA